MGGHRARRTGRPRYVHVYRPAPSAADPSWAPLGEFVTPLAGTRHHAGARPPSSRVALVREPANPHDRWAIRVDNLAGEAIGYVKREVAGALAPLLDGGALRLRGFLPEGPGTQWYRRPDLYLLVEQRTGLLIFPQRGNGWFYQLDGKKRDPGRYGSPPS